MSHFYTRGCSILSNIAYYQHQKVAISILFIVFMDGTQLNSILNSSFEKKLLLLYQSETGASALLMTVQ